jgi:hypothetical protein
MIRDLSYAAKSTKDPKGSTERQLARIAAAIAAEGREPYGRAYVDEGATAFHGNRGADLAAVMAEAERLTAAGDQVSLWVDHSDRTSRGDGVEARHTVEMMLWALKAGVQLRSVRDPDTFRSLSAAANTGDRNHGDGKVKGERVAEGHAERRAAGGYHGGPPAYGLRYPVDPDQPTRRIGEKIIPNTRPWLPLEHHPEQAPVVVIMHRLVAEGLGINAIAARLNADGYQTMHGARWRGGSVRAILRNPIYAARAKDGSALAHAPIVDPETWQRTLATLQARAVGPAKGGRPTAQPALFLNGHLRCGICGDAMGYRAKANRRSLWERYVCTRREHDSSACEQTPVDVHAVEGAVLEAFRQRAMTRSSALAEWQAVYEADLAHVVSLRKGAEQEAAKAAAAMARVKGDYKAGEISAADWRELRGELQAELAAAASHAERMRGREDTVRVRASGEVHDAFSEAMTALGHAADRALRGEVALEGVREALRTLFPAPVYRDGRVDLGEPAAEYVALLVDDELEGAAGEPILDRLKASAATGALGLTSAPVIAPIPVDLEVD